MPSTGQHRSTQRKTPTTPDDEAALTADIIELARQYGRYGYRRIMALRHWRKIRVLTIVDTFNRFSPAVDLRFSYRGEDVVLTLKRICKTVGYLKADFGAGSAFIRRLRFVIRSKNSFWFDDRLTRAVHQRAKSKPCSSHNSSASRVSFRSQVKGMPRLLKSFLMQAAICVLWDGMRVGLSSPGGVTGGMARGAPLFVSSICELVWKQRLSAGPLSTS